VTHSKVTSIVSRWDSWHWALLTVRSQNTKGRVCCSKNFSAEEVSTLFRYKSSRQLDETSGTSWMFSSVPDAEIQSWIDAKEWSDLSKSVRHDHPRAETTWFHRGSWYPPERNASERGYWWRAPVPWSPSQWPVKKSLCKRSIIISYSLYTQCQEI
jgi:hypothetical protein